MNSKKANLFTAPMITGRGKGEWGKVFDMDEKEMDERVGASGGGAFYPGEGARKEGVERFWRYARIDDSNFAGAGQGVKAIVDPLAPGSRCMRVMSLMKLLLLRATM